jgi:hypothetical protein
MGAESGRVLDKAVRRSQLRDSVPRVMTGRKELREFWENREKLTKDGVTNGVSLALTATSPADLSSLILDELETYSSISDHADDIVMYPITQNDITLIRAYRDEEPLFAKPGEDAILPDHEQEIAVGRLKVRNLRRLTQKDMPFADMQREAAILTAQVYITVNQQDEHARQNLPGRMTSVRRITTTAFTSVAALHRSDEPVDLARVDETLAQVDANTVKIEALLNETD